MYTKSLIQYMSFVDKLRVASIDMQYRPIFLKSEKPPLHYHNMAFDNDDITGFNTLLMFYTNIHSFESTYNLIKRSFKSGKIAILRWLLDIEEKTISSKVRYFKKEIKRLYTQCANGTMCSSKKMTRYITKKVIKDTDYFWEIDRNIDDILSEDDLTRFKNIYESVPHRKLSEKNLMELIKSHQAERIYKYIQYTKSW